MNFRPTKGFIEEKSSFCVPPDHARLSRKRRVETTLRDVGPVLSNHEQPVLLVTPYRDTAAEIFPFENILKISNGSE
jgi:hypothetical protein